MSPELEYKIIEIIQKLNGCGVFMTLEILDMNVCLCYSTVPSKATSESLPYGMSLIVSLKEVLIKRGYHVSLSREVC